MGGIYHSLGYFQELHFQKPQLLEVYKNQALADGAARGDGDALKRDALKLYQVASFTQMFHALSSKGRFLMNRSHLGEYVYAKRYRGYDGSYVFDIEKHFQDLGSDFADTTLLVLVHTSDLSFITEDGQSLGGLDKREAEQDDFIRAFERSVIRHKLMVDVHDGQGRFVSRDKILDAVLNAWERFHLYGAPILHVTWQVDGDAVNQVNHLQEDPKRGIA